MSDGIAPRFPGGDGARTPARRGVSVGVGQVVPGELQVTPRSCWSVDVVTVVVVVVVAGAVVVVIGVVAAVVLVGVFYQIVHVSQARLFL